MILKTNTWHGGAFRTRMSVRDPSDPVSIHPKHPDFQKSLDELRSLVGCDCFVAQRLAFNNKITDLRLDDSQVVTTEVTGFLRTKDPTEALLLPRKYADGDATLAGLVMNADCPLIFLMNDDVFGLVHAPLKSLDPQEQDGLPVTMAVVNHICEHYDSSLENTLWSVAYGAGPESYGFNLNDPKWGAKNQALFDRMSRWHTSGRKVVYPPRKGWAAIDLFEIIEKQLTEAGVPHTNLEIDRTDTSSLGLSVAQMENLGTHGYHYSNIHAGECDKAAAWNPRNASVISYADLT